MNTEQQTPAHSPQKSYSEMSFEERIDYLKGQQSDLSKGSWKRSKTKQGGKR